MDDSVNRSDSVDRAFELYQNSKTLTKKAGFVFLLQRFCDILEIAIFVIFLTHAVWLVNDVKDVKEN